ncbi:unnamed protein product [Protopolystoma xenopodis]|uniref:Uncharacterized protein n=1 Tax=Protopolystoma xenopodis TaxID=117903 RepID=A0A448WHY5_9PLAT|nr:unnamed protein product [Protopolystoma xenopodis]
MKFISYKDYLNFLQKVHESIWSLWTQDEDNLSQIASASRDRHLPSSVGYEVMLTLLLPDGRPKIPGLVQEAMRPNKLYSDWLALVTNPNEWLRIALEPSLAPWARLAHINVQTQRLYAIGLNQQKAR